MKRLLRYLNLPVFLAESLGLTLLLAGAYSLFIIQNGETLRLLFDSPDFSELPNGRTDVSWGELHSSTFSWLAKARITVFFLSLIIVIVKKHEGRNLYWNALLLIVPGIFLLLNGVEQSVNAAGYNALNLFLGEDENLKHGILCFIFVSLGFFFLFINTSPIQKVFSKLFKKPLFNGPLTFL